MNSIQFCGQCGGVTVIHSDTASSDVVVEDSGNGPEVRIGQMTYKCCTGHQLKHDGRLDKEGRYTVELWEGASGSSTVDITENVSGYTISEPERVELTPKQALSLLAWLKQEEATLQKLVEEKK